MPVHGQHPGLRPDLVGGEDPVHRHEQEIPVQQLQVPSELLNPIGFAGSFDLPLA
jgi:hypothetical protein